MMVFSVDVSAAASKTKYVIVMVIDGSRYVETFGDPTHQYIPRLWNTLRPQGTIFTNLYIDGYTETNPGHSTILTGAWQLIKNDGTERPHQPTVFEYFRKSSSVSSTETYVILGKSKLNILSNSDHAEYGAAYAASVQTSASQYADLYTWNNVKTVLSGYRPKLSIVNMAQTDNAGHANNWAGYTSAIWQADSLIYETWKLIQNDSAMAEKTTLIVVNDHGRHTTSFTSHGDACDGCRHILCLMIGPDTPAGVVDSTLRKQIDIAPTIGVLLGFATPYAAGTVMSVAVNPQTVSVAGYRLENNYPNPFNPSTAISYEVPEQSNVSVSIYNIAGVLVRTLSSHSQYAAGKYSRRWNGTNDEGTSVASGIYLVRMSAESFARSGVRYSVTKKIVLIR
jgi:hypothetical protein